MDAIYENVFLAKLFPNGIEKSIFIGQVEFSSHPHMRICIHTKQKPADEVSKWGVWGENYDIIVIELYTWCKVAKIENWQENEYFGELEIEILRNSSFNADDGLFLLSYKSGNVHLELECGKFRFERCSTYIWGPDEYTI